MKDVPWLNHLRRDHRGIYVPYINMWGGEDVARMSVRYDPHVGRDAMFLDDTAETVPDFKHQHMARQRRCMVLGLCQICERHVPWSRRFLVVGPGIDTVEIFGKGWHNVLTEPWLDERCARFALDHCPALIRRRRDEQLLLVQVRERDCTLVVSEGYLDGPLELATRERPAAMWVKVLLPRIALISAPLVGATS